MKSILIFSFLIIVTELHSDEDYRKCKDILIDQVTNIAFGNQGQPFTGKVKCYYDEKKTKLKSIRIFNKGIPIGTHQCYLGTKDYHYIIDYKNGHISKFKLYNGNKNKQFISCKSRAGGMCEDFYIFFKYCS